jgi:hypothetical protein
LTGAAGHTLKGLLETPYRKVFAIYLVTKGFSRFFEGVEKVYMKILIQKGFLKAYQKTL